MKKATLWATLIATMLLGGCDSLLDAGDDYNDTTRITENVDFVAVSATCAHYPAGSREYTDRENYTIELLGNKSGSMRDAMILDLINPKGTPSPVGTYEVANIGSFLALPRYNVTDTTTGQTFFGGSFYGRAVDGYIGDYFAFLTSGTVIIAHNPESNTYTITVDARSGDYTIRVAFEGPMTITKVE